MTDRPIVSVVAVFYDDQRFLGEAIASVRAQTLTEWELLLVDDGSSDGSTEMARAAARDDHRVRYLEHPGHANRGISATRNLGLAHTQGTYVAFLDSDDVWNPVKLAEQVAILEAHPRVGLLFGSSLYWWSWAGRDAPREDEVKRIGAAPDRAHSPPSLLLQLYPLGKGVAPCPSSCIARRDVIERLGGFEEDFRTMYEDQTFLTKAYLGTDVWVSSRCWDRYRRHEGAITLTTSQEQYWEVRGRFLDWFDGYLGDHLVQDPRIHTAVRKARWSLRHPRLSAGRRAAGIARSRLRRRLGGVRR